jgi:hypothetical protein
MRITHTRGKGLYDSRGQRLGLCGHALNADLTCPRSWCRYSAAGIAAARAEANAIIQAKAQPAVTTTTLTGAQAMPLATIARRGLTVSPSLAVQFLATAVGMDIVQHAYNYDRELVREFQRSKGLPVTGIYGPQTERALRDTGLDYAPKALFDYESSPAAPQSSSFVDRDDAVLSGLLQHAKVMGLGNGMIVLRFMRGEAVRQLQHKCNHSGMRRKHVGLVEDGLAGPSTCSALRKLVNTASRLLGFPISPYAVGANGYDLEVSTTAAICRMVFGLQPVDAVRTDVMFKDGQCTRLAERFHGGSPLLDIACAIGDLVPYYPGLAVDRVYALGKIGICVTPRTAFWLEDGICDLEVTLS